MSAVLVIACVYFALVAWLMRRWPEIEDRLFR